jgi:hypothetical protein
MGSRGFASSGQRHHISFQDVIEHAALRSFTRSLTDRFQAGASYRQRQDSREQGKKQHLIGTVDWFLGIHGADKGSSQQREHPLKNWRWTRLANTQEQVYYLLNKSKASSKLISP